MTRAHHAVGGSVRSGAPVRIALSALATALVASLLLAAPLGRPADATQGVQLERISGDDGIVVAAAVSQRFAVDTDTVVLARADAYPDALAGAPLARLRGAPILLVPRSAPLPQVVFNELDRLDPSTAIVLGGPAAIDGSVVDAVQQMGITAQRIGGGSRFETAAMIADVVAAETGARDAYVVRGGHPSPSSGWPDAVAVSALAAAQGRPILLSDGAALDQGTVGVLDRRGIDGVDVVGGTAVVDDSVLEQLRRTGRDADRIWGPTRFETSMAVAEAGFADGMDLGDTFLVTGGNYADPLVTAVHAGAARGTMLLVDGRSWEGSSARRLLLDRFGELERVTVVGSGNSVPVTVDHEIVDTARPAPAFPAAGAVRLPVGSDLQRGIEAHPPGTTFLIEAGVHRGQTITPRKTDTIIGEPGAVLDGGVVLDPATAGVGERGLHVLPTPPLTAQPVDPAVEMVPGHEREALPNELWAGHVRMRHVNTREAVDAPGEFFLDYDRDQILMFEDPRTVPDPLVLSVTPEAITTVSGSKTEGVTIRNLTITHYANRPSRGVVDLGDAVGWDVGYLTVIDNHGVGVRTGPGLHLHHSRVVRNGQMGIVGTDSDFGDIRAPLLIERNEVSFNGELGFEWAWEGGSIKFGGTDGLRLIGNWVHNHPGPGPWMDEFGFRTTFAENLVEHNGINGLMHEISTDGTIVDNIVRYNGILAFGDLGSGVWVSNSPDVEVGWNVIEGNRLPINAQTSPPQEGRKAMPIEDLLVHHNDIRIDHLLPGMRVTSDATYVYTDGNNRFEDNRYRTRLDYPWHFWWGDVYDIPGWQRLGFDVDGEFVDIEQSSRTAAGRPTFSPTSYGAARG